MKRYWITALAIILCAVSYAQVQLYLGARGGIGAIATYDNLPNTVTIDGLKNTSHISTGRATSVKGEALLGLGKFRIGYQFLYNFSSPARTFTDYNPVTEPNRYTNYYNNRQEHFFGHYLLIEYAIINSRHFSLAPGIAAGIFNGFRVDNTTNERVRLSDVTTHRFSAGVELNIEVKFGRTVIFLSPNYYFFYMKDKDVAQWYEARSLVGADLGLRFNLLKGTILPKPPKPNQ